MGWNVSEYERFRDERARPFFELVSRIPAFPARSVVDIGCGTGELTATLIDRFPEAVILGMDSSPEMLAAARPRAVPGRLQFEPGDAGRFAPAAPVDVILSNAALQWLPEHERLIARLANLVGPGGVLAVQVPGNFDAPSHALLRATAAESPWAAALAGVLRDPPVLPLARYAELLLGAGFEVDAWETTYLHIMDGPDPVLRWVRGTALRPVLDALPPGDAQAFTDRYAARLRDAYPPSAHGTLFPFRRVFIVARRPVTP
jgi:trans-aconitate 2-methyltransferase